MKTSKSLINEVVVQEVYMFFIIQLCVCAYRSVRSTTYTRVNVNQFVDRLIAGVTPSHHNNLPDQELESTCLRKKETEARKLPGVSTRNVIIILSIHMFFITIFYYHRLDNQTFR